jgi:glutaconate CoA-transferase subunit A
MTQLTKQISLRDAASLLQDRHTLALGGLMLYRRPTAFVYEVLRRATPPTGLTLLTFTAGYESDLLVGAGCISRVRTCYFGLESFGFAPMFTAAAQNGSLHIQEETEVSLAAGLRATMHGVSFTPSTAWQGTDLLRLRPDVKTIQDPYTGQTLTAFPAIRADIAVIHALVADRQGNCRLNDNWGMDRELVMVAERVIVTAEEVVDSLTEGVTLSGVVVDQVVHAPQGASPSSCYPHYPVDGLELLDYMDDCIVGQFPTYLEKVLHGKS